MTEILRSGDPQAQVTQFDRFARFYDADYRHYQEDLQMVADLAQEAGGPVLELGCGTGRALLPLALIGLDGAGVDVSPALLAQAQARLTAAGVAGQMHLHQADMRGMDLTRKDFGFAFSVSNTFMHLTTPQDQQLALARAHAHLRPDGYLLLDLFNPDIARLIQVEGMQELADSWIDPESGATVHKWVVRRLNLADQVQETLFIYEEIFADGRVQRTNCPFSLRYLWRHEGELMLQQAGFAVEAIWGDFDGAPYEDGCERLIFWARKG